MEKQTLKEYVKQVALEQDEPLQFLEYVQAHGCQSGIVPELIYYSDTLAFYKKFKREISDLLSELLENTGESPSEIFRGWDDSDPLALDTQNQNLLAWFAFEETAREILESEELELDEDEEGECK